MYHLVCNDTYNLIFFIFSNISLWNRNYMKLMLLNISFDTVVFFNFHHFFFKYVKLTVVSVIMSHFKHYCNWLWLEIEFVESFDWENPRPLCRLRTSRRNFVWISSFLLRILNQKNRKTSVENSQNVNWIIFLLLMKEIHWKIHITINPPFI